MSRFFSPLSTADFRGWAVCSLDQHEAFVLTGDPDSPVKARRDLNDYSYAVVIREKTENEDELFVLLSPPGILQQVRVNGDPIFAGIRVLQHRDEIVVRSHFGGSHRLYFSTEKIARIEQLPAHPHNVSCARCLKHIETGTGVIRCPSCSAVHHQSDEYNCWSYSSQCANSICYQDTEMNADFRWVP